MSEKYDIQTRFVHSADRSLDQTGSTSFPIYQTASYSYDSAEEIEDAFAGVGGFSYSRSSNPSNQFLENRVNELEDGVGAVCFSSGMAAINNVVLDLAQAGEEIISSRSVFGGTYIFFQGALERSGIKTKFFDITNPSEIESLVTDKTRMIFIETIANPVMEIADMEQLSAIAKKFDLPLVVDNTATTPLLFQPKYHGGDVIIHSATKFMSGHGNAIGGVVVDSGTYNWDNGKFPHIAQFIESDGEKAFIVSLRKVIFKHLGSCLSPFNCFLISMGIESMGVRMERQCANAQQVSQFFESHKLVTEVLYPGLESHPQHDLAKKQFGDMFGGILSIKLGSKEKCFTFINNLKLARNATNLGDAKTLVIHVASTISRNTPFEERQVMGVTDDLIRMSIGLEKAEDLIADMQQALEKIK